MNKIFLLVLSILISFNCAYSDQLTYYDEISTQNQWPKLHKLIMEKKFKDATSVLLENPSLINFPVYTPFEWANNKDYILYILENFDQEDNDLPILLEPSPFDAENETSRITLLELALYSDAPKEFIFLLLELGDSPTLSSNQNDWPKLHKLIVQKKFEEAASYLLNDHSLINFPVYMPRKSFDWWDDEAYILETLHHGKHRKDYPPDLHDAMNLDNPYENEYQTFKITPLELAIQSDAPPELICLLLQLGADPNSKRETIEQAPEGVIYEKTIAQSYNVQLWTPLYAAIIKRNYPVIDILQEHGADPNKVLFEATGYKVYFRKDVEFRGKVHGWKKIADIIDNKDKGYK